MTKAIRNHTDETKSPFSSSSGLETRLNHFQQRATKACKPYPYPAISLRIYSGWWSCYGSYCFNSELHTLAKLLWNAFQYSHRHWQRKQLYYYSNTELHRVAKNAHPILHVPTQSYTCWQNKLFSLCLHLSSPTLILPTNVYHFAYIWVAMT